MAHSNSFDERDDEPGRESSLHYGHPRMPLEERAKLFSPFEPLRGFRDELRRREDKMRKQHEGF